MRVISTARRIRESAAVGKDVPVVVFCIDEIAEGDEVSTGKNVRVSRPDNSNQLRDLFIRLLRKPFKGGLSGNNATFITTTEREIMIGNTQPEKPFTFRFIDAQPRTLLELTNATDQTLKSIEIVTVFLKDEATPGGGPSQAHIRFEGVDSMKPGEKAILSHRTWINGRPADTDHDQLGRLKTIAGKVNPYVLDVSWQNAEGRTRFQRIPVGH